MTHGPGDDYDGDSSTDEDDPPPHEAVIKIGLKNQALFDDESSASVPFLDPEQASKHACYREAYGHMLGVWGLEMQRNEVLKYNGIISARDPKHSERDSQSTLTLGRYDTHGPGENQGPHVVRCCAKCSSVDVNALGGSLEAKCSRCNAKSQTMPCTVCLQAVHGLYKACLSCGHAAHASCLQLLLEHLPEDELACEAGCGCICEDHAVVDGDTIFTGLEEPQVAEVAVVDEPVDVQGGSYQALRDRRASIAEARRLNAERVRREPDRPGVAHNGRRRSFVH